MLMYSNNDKKTVLSQGKPRDAFWHHWKADEGQHTRYNNAGIISKVSKQIATESFKYRFFSIIDPLSYSLGDKWNIGSVVEVTFLM